MDYKALSNLASMFFDQADLLGDKPFLWGKEEEIYRCKTYGDVADEVCKIANGLISIGIRKGDRVMIVSENRPEWVIADLAITAIGAIVVPAYTTNTTDDHFYVAEHSQAKAAFISTQGLMKKFSGAATKSETCKTVIAMDNFLEQENDGLNQIKWDSINSNAFIYANRSNSSIRVSSFNLGEVLSEESIEKFSGELSFESKIPADLKFLINDFHAELTSVTIENNLYENVSIYNGSFEANKLACELQIDDKKLKMKVKDVSLDFNKGGKHAFKIDLEQALLNSLDIVSNDTLTTFKTDMEVNLYGSLDNLEGISSSFAIILSMVSASTRAKETPISCSALVI